MAGNESHFIIRSSQIKKTDKAVAVYLDMGLATTIMKSRH